MKIVQSLMKYSVKMNERVTKLEEELLDLRK